MRISIFSAALGCAEPVLRATSDGVGSRTKRMTMKPKMVCLLALLALAIGSQGLALASSGYLAAFKTTYPASASRLESCTLCHTTTPALSSFGSQFAANLPVGSTPDQAFAAIEALDSDGDGYTNLEELAAGSMPGDLAERPDTLVDALNGAGADTAGSVSIPDQAQDGSTTIINIFNNIYNSGQTQGGGTTSPTPANNAAACANCHTDGRSGALPSGHQDISAYLPGATVNPGGPTLTNDAAVCITCHTDGKSGAAPSGHPDISQLTQILFDASEGATPGDNAAICARCHDDRSGTIPGDHPNLTGNLGGGEDDEEEDDDD